MRLAMIVCFCLLLVGCGGGSKKDENHPQSQRFALLGGTPPTMPGDLEATPTTTTVALTWSASTDAQGIQSYEVFDNGRAKRFLGPLGAFYTRTGLTCGKPHTFAVRARDPAGNISKPAVVHTATSSCTPTGQVFIASDGDDGTCERGDPDLACESFDKAYEISEEGDGIEVACGTYGYQTFTSNKSAGDNVVFYPATAGCVTMGGLDYRNGGNYSTLRGMIIVQDDGAIVDSGTNPSQNLVFEDNQINVGIAVTEANVNFKAPVGLQFVGNTVGPTCCGTGTNSPEGLRIGTADGSVHNATNVLIDDNHIHATVRNCTYWPSGFGSCPGTNCPGCHSDGIHIWGFVDSVISNNDVEDPEVQAIFIEPSNASLNSNVNITGNTVSVQNGNAGIYIKAGSTNSTSGTWNITGNHTGTTLLELGAGFAGAIAGTVFNISGNTGVLLITDSGGNNAGCTGYPGTVTINYSGNTWTPATGTTGCG